MSREKLFRLKILKDIILNKQTKMITINKERFLYVIIAIMIIDLIIDGIDDFGTRLYLTHLIRSMLIIGFALILSINSRRKNRLH